MGTRRINMNICRNGEVSDIMTWRGRDCSGLYIMKILLDFWYILRGIRKSGVRSFSIREAKKWRRGGRSGRKKSGDGSRGEQSLGRVGFVNSVFAKTLDSAGATRSRRNRRNRNRCGKRVSGRSIN